MWLLVVANLAGKIAALFVGWTSPATALALWFGPDALLAYHLFGTRTDGSGYQGQLGIYRVEVRDGSGAVLGETNFADGGGELSLYLRPRAGGGGSHRYSDRA